jgi:hypothetical protein
MPVLSKIYFPINLKTLLRMLLIFLNPEVYVVTRRVLLISKLRILYVLI